MTECSTVRGVGLSAAGSPEDADAAPVAKPNASEGAEEAVEDARTQRRCLAAVWLSAGSATAAMVALGWYLVVANGGSAPGGDMIGHAAAAEWLRTLPWWDWRGWSDWFYGGQAIGVNYPPLGHAWMRFTHPVHGQMAAVALGLLVLLPWGVLRLARAVGYPPRSQRAAVGAVMVLVAASAHMHWMLSGFHIQRTFFGSWPAMLAVVAGLFVAAWAARCARPAACGAVAGVAVLLNASVVPGVAVVCAALLATSGATLRQSVRWTVTAGAAALAVCSWWLVPFMAGWARLVRWDVPLWDAWQSGGDWQLVVLASVAAAAAWAARCRPGPARRLALASGAGLLATVAADLFGYLRPERWLQAPLLVAALAMAGLVAAGSGRGSQQPVRPAWKVLAVCFLTVFTVITLRLEVLPLAVWLLFGRPRRTWVWSGALAWAAVLLFVPFWAEIRNPQPVGMLSASPTQAVVDQSGSDAEGLVFGGASHNSASSDVGECSLGNPWIATANTGGRIRLIDGLYSETSESAEFVLAENRLRNGAFKASSGPRPHWFDAWDAAGRASLKTPVAAEALGARWYFECDGDGNFLVTELSATMAVGTVVAPFVGDDAWHNAAVRWWVATVSGDRTGFASAGPVPILSPSGGETVDHPAGQAARGVTVAAAQDQLTIEVEHAGWVWLRVPWDPDWRSAGGTPVRKGGPGHLVVWTQQGATELRWSIPGAVDAAAAGVTAAAVCATSLLAALNRRRGFRIDPDRTSGLDTTLAVFADTVDEWAHAAARRTRRLLARTRIRREPQRW